MRYASMTLAVLGFVLVLALIGCNRGSESGNGSESGEQISGSESGSESEAAEHSKASESGSRSESGEHSKGSEAGSGSEAGEHSEGSEAGSGSEAGEGGEESGAQFALGDTFDEVRAGARLVLSYDLAANVFKGKVENTTGATLSRVRVEVHLSNGIELGPTTPVDPAPGQVVEVTLPASSQPFASWSAHPEVG